VDDPINEEDDSLYDPPPPGPSPNELRKQAAERGDVDYFLDIFRTKAWSLFRVGEMLRYLMRAAEVRARSDPEAYARELFGMMVGFNSFLLLRTQIYVADQVVGRGPQPLTPTLADLSNDVVERLLPRLAEIQKATAELLVAQAQAARLWGLARAKEARAEREAQSDRPRAHPHSTGRKTGRSRPDATRAKAKTEGPRDGVDPLPSRDRRRG
jgi:hypothetical protein